MGSGASKPEEPPKAQILCSRALRYALSPLNPSSHIRQPKSDIPQKSDSTRAKTLELHIQARVASELKKLQERASKDFEELTTKLSNEESSPPSEEKSAGDSLRQLGRNAVQKDVEGLRKKLEQRKKVQDLDEGVEKAKSEVVRCLRENDRRPLDCYKEVEAFRREVRRLEGKWVEGIVR
ncbi:putative altered inheritance of mitochondria protein 13, mitochondrial [Sclerotinia borealis F-4128]|uniref:Putative altered inheritance of mitochondria protein 13, mitochondrial n=1 Tax=Sclerotinia borealis (strain F-4128) TaxID=1432307 RepID=W9C9R9_SCLBF|nr:putative altered inheritance of mitochondria protein 13, mitochondrial [Sclerotinia borealis F-4128]